ncbi:MAG TPA: ribonuclease H-like domain-containing protein [Candidatus Limnocylindrales bacterium]|nr:ribonuclease H-like domain-containing protein [Candidatus Limnocylindrales bacterium]
MTGISVPVTRERRLANLRATLARSGGGTGGADVEPARAPFSGRRSPVLAARLASALAADVIGDEGALLVRRVVAPVEIPVDRERLARLPGHPPENAPLVCLDTETTGLATAAGTLAFLVGLARWDGDAFRQTQLLLPDHADEPALLAEIARWITPDTWLVSYNGKGFDWPLIEARFRMAGRPAPAHAGHLDLLPFVRKVFRHRMENARLRSVETELLGVSRVGDVEGWEIPQIYLEVLRGGPIGPLAGVVIHNEKDVRSLGLLLAHVEHRYADRGARHDAPRGDLAGLARAYARDRRHGEALECLDDALAAPPPVRDPFGRTPLPPASARQAAHEESDDWWSPRVRPHFGGLAPVSGGGWRGALANGRGGPLGPSPSAAAWDTGSDRWTDERLAAERARTLRRLGRWSEAAEAWQAAAAAGGGLGAIAWIEVAKLREHRLGDPGGALAATRAAWRLLERLRVTGRAHPRLEADLQRRGTRLAARIGRRAGPAPGTPTPAGG